jgi:FkbM family methyltransferase
MLSVVDSRHGKIIVPQYDEYVGRGFVKYGEFSEGEVLLFDQYLQPGMVVADIGANFGAHTLVFAKKAARVYAVEPQRMVFNALCGTVAINLLYNVITLHAAIGAESGRVGHADLNFDVKNNAGAVGLKDINPEKVTYQIPLMPFLFPCNFMKVDVEGMEIDVIRGAEPMLRDCRPIIYIENDRASKSAELIDAIRSVGYDLYWHYTELFNPNNYFKDQENIFPGVGSLNMLCLPPGFPAPALRPVTVPLCEEFTYTH